MSVVCSFIKAMNGTNDVIVYMSKSVFTAKAGHMALTPMVDVFALQEHIQECTEELKH